MTSWTDRSTTWAATRKLIRASLMISCACVRPATLSCTLLVSDNQNQHRYHFSQVERKSVFILLIMHAWNTRPPNITFGTPVWEECCNYPKLPLLLWIYTCANVPPLTCHPGEGVPPLIISDYFSWNVKYSTAAWLFYFLHFLTLYFNYLWNSPHRIPCLSLWFLWIKSLNLYCHGNRWQSPSWGGICFGVHTSVWISVSCIVMG